MKKIFIERNKLFKSINLLLCNEITKADENFVEDNMELFFTPCETCKGTGYTDEKEEVKCEECGGEGEHECEAYQFFLCSLDEWEKERLTSYGVSFGHCNLLELDVLPIYDYGTSWSAFSYSKDVADDYELSFDETLTRATPY